MMADLMSLKRKEYRLFLIKMVIYHEYFSFTLYRISHLLYVKGIPLLPYLITICLRIFFGCWLPAEAKIGLGSTLGKGALGIVIHEKSIIGERAIISNNVTLVGSSKKQSGKLPVLGSRVRIGSGAAIIGGVTIGDNVIIAANSVVVDDVESNSIVVGNPARVLKTEIDINEYIN